MPIYLRPYLLCAILLLIFPELALASNAFEQGLCNISNAFTQACYVLSIIALIIFGILMLLGKGTWGLALIHLVGAIVIGVAGEIVNNLGGVSGSCP